MIARHLALGIGAALLLGLGVYLFVQVRAESAPPEAPHPRVTERERTAPEPAEPPPEARPRPVAPPPRPTAAVPAPPISPPAPSAAPPPPEQELFGPRLDAAMDEANKAYDRGDFDEARTIAGRVLVGQPSNVRMLRIVVSSACIDGDAAAAQTHFSRLPPGDQAQMRTRCSRYGISFPGEP